MFKEKKKMKKNNTDTVMVFCTWNPLANFIAQLLLTYPTLLSNI